LIISYSVRLVQRNYADFYTAEVKGFIGYWYNTTDFNRSSIRAFDGVIYVKAAEAVALSQKLPLSSIGFARDDSGSCVSYLTISAMET